MKIDADTLVQKKLTGTIGSISGDFVTGFDIDTSPTIDAAPVVRCRECKYGKESKISFDCDGKTPLCECPHMMLTHQWDEYCSFGEQK